MIYIRRHWVPGRYTKGIMGVLRYVANILIQKNNSLLDM